MTFQCTYKIQITVKYKSYFPSKLKNKETKTLVHYEYNVEHVKIP